MSSPIDQTDAQDTALTDSVFEGWPRGYGVIRHPDDAVANVQALAAQLVAARLQPDTDAACRKLAALDRLTSAGLWLVVHMTYCNRVDLSGADLAAKGFK